MADLLDKASQLLASVRRDSLARSVTYVRGTTEFAISATAGNQTFERIDNSGFAIEIKTRDFIVATEDLVIDSVEIKPEKGDEIHDTVGGVERRYAVIHESGGLRWQFSDPQGRLIRIHTKEVGES